MKTLPVPPQMAGLALHEIRTFFSNPKTAWKLAAKGIELSRMDPVMEKLVVLEDGVAFFVLALEALGCLTFHSCEGHPHGFYIAFYAPLP